MGGRGGRPGWSDGRGGPAVGAPLARRSGAARRRAQRGPTVRPGWSLQGSDAHSVALRPRVTLLHDAPTHALAAAGEGGNIGGMARGCSRACAAQGDRKTAQGNAALARITPRTPRLKNVPLPPRAAHSEQRARRRAPPLRPRARSLDGEGAGAGQRQLARLRGRHAAARGDGALGGRQRGQLRRRAARRAGAACGSRAMRGRGRRLSAGARRGGDGGGPRFWTVRCRPCG
jgi:hypothetical protein